MHASNQRPLGAGARCSEPCTWVARGGHQPADDHPHYYRRRHTPAVVVGVVGVPAASVDAHQLEGVDDWLRAGREILNGTSPVR